MNSQTGFRSSPGGTPCGVLYGEERRPAPASVYLREPPVFDRIEFGAVRRIMHAEDVHIQSVGKFHEILLDDAVRACIGASAVAEDDHRMRIRILLPQIGFPYPLDVVADELGRVMVGPECEVDLVPGDIVDAMRDDLPVGERLEVVVIRFGLSHAEHLAVPLEVADKFLFLCVNAEDWVAEFGALLSRRRCEGTGHPAPRHPAWEDL